MNNNEKAPHLLILTATASTSNGHRHDRDQTLPEQPMPFAVTHVGGVPFQATTLEAACNWILNAAMTPTVGVNVRLANAYNIALAHKNPAYRSLLIEEGVNFPDGAPVVWFMRRNVSTARRVRGPSLFARTLELSENRELRHFFLGGTPETLRQLETVIRQAHPGLKIAGTYSPPFADVDEAFIADCARRVVASNATIVWIGLGTPKQDQLGTVLARRADIILVNVGAAFDFTAGTAKEAPRWIQSSGFEWLYRLIQEPRRLWKRYLIGNLQFLFAATISASQKRPRGGKR